MAEQGNDTVVRMEAAQAMIRDAFLGWQCRIRQLAVRHADGRPTDGMRPLVTPLDREGRPGEPMGQITLLLNKADPYEETAQFKHMVRKTNDPAERLESALKMLQAAYYQQARDFSDVMTALFGPDSAAVERLLSSGLCRLDFEQYSQRFSFPCKIWRLQEQESGWQATFWHNSLFNPNLPGGVQILAFQPDWAHAEAEPPVPQEQG